MLCGVLAFPAGLPAVTPRQRLAANSAAYRDAVADYQVASARLERAASKVRRTESELDRLFDEQAAAEKRLSGRAAGLYRAGRTRFVEVLMTAESFESFSARWSLLTRIASEDARAVREVKAARKRTARAARGVMRDQERAAARLRELAAIKAAAERDLGASRIEYAAFREQVAAREERPPAAVRAPAPRAPKRAKDPSPTRTGSGAWSRGVASHYGRNFSGRGASGERIGPDSMIVAHKTLPFGTLVEFRYRGKRAVARVVDRGPYTKGRMWDLGPGVIRVLGFSGVHSVEYRVIGR